MLRNFKVMNTQIQKILDDFARTTDKIYTLEELKEKLASGKQLRIKYGVDVTAPFLHLGHAVNLWMMRKLQEAGHKVVFLIGDFTTRIGDPTGKSQTRPVIPQEEIEKNAREFIKQVSGILITDDPNVFEIRRNSEWFDKMPLSRFLSLLAMVTHARLISRDMFQKRIQENAEIYMHEMIYPLLQGYDSYMLESDLTIVGSDQLFNEMMGRFYQEKFGQTPQIIITTKITPGLDGKNKQSKSLNNYIAITDTPQDKFGKTMSLPDELIFQWMEVYTDIPMEKINEYQELLKTQNINPRNLKLELASEIVRRYHDDKTANESREWFLNTFSARKFPEDAPVVEFVSTKTTLLKFLKSLLPKMSNSELRRLIQGGGVEINEKKHKNPFEEMNPKQGEVLKVKAGKRKFFKVKIL